MKYGLADVRLLCSEGDWWRAREIDLKMLKDAPYEEVREYVQPWMPSLQKDVILLSQASLLTHLTHHQPLSDIPCGSSVYNGDDPHFYLGSRLISPLHQVYVPTRKLALLGEAFLTSVRGELYLPYRSAKRVRWYETCFYEGFRNLYQKVRFLEDERDRHTVFAYAVAYAIFAEDLLNGWPINMEEQAKRLLKSSPYLELIP